MLHYMHLVSPSSVPIGFSFALLGFGINIIGIFRFSLPPIVFPFLLLCGYFWGRDVVREGSYLGKHTRRVTRSFLISIKLFILSEVMFFGGFFAALLSAMYSADASVGLSFPPKGINPVSPWGLPVLNTILLLSSGCTICCGHYSGNSGNLEGLLEGLLDSLFFGFCFLFVQMIEYWGLDFTISSSIYSSCFYTLTSFHGFHVILGCTIIGVSYLRGGTNFFGKMAGVHCTVWYWHFVDIVWIILYLILYLQVYYLK